MVLASLVLWYTFKNVESRRNAKTPKKAQFKPCTVVLYDKGCTIQRTGCLVTGYHIQVASRSHAGSRPMASPMQGMSIYFALVLV